MKDTLTDLVAYSIAAVILFLAAHVIVGLAIGHAITVLGSVPI